MKRIVVASNNEGKIKEIKEILTGYEVISLKEAGIDIDPEETGKTFAENARIKADAVSALTDDIVLADDSGLSVDALDGFPGVNSHRFLGENATDEDRNNYIIEQLKGKTGEERKAHFTTVIAVIKNKKPYIVVGDIDCYIAEEPRQKRGRGFGFDPILVVKDGLTLAQIRSYEKNMISSRRKALTKIKKLGIL